MPPGLRRLFHVSPFEGDDGTARIHLDNLGVTGCGFLQQFEQLDLENPGSVTLTYPYVDDGEGASANQSSAHLSFVISTGRS